MRSFCIDLEFSSGTNDWRSRHVKAGIGNALDLRVAENPKNTEAKSAAIQCPFRWHQKCAAGDPAETPQGSWQDNGDVPGASRSEKKTVRVAEAADLAGWLRVAADPSASPSVRGKCEAGLKQTDQTSQAAINRKAVASNGRTQRNALPICKGSPTLKQGCYS
jgi:hypothetical protein